MGYVVGRTPSGTAYIVPLADALAQIKRVLSAKAISLPDPILSLAKLEVLYESAEDDENAKLALSILQSHLATASTATSASRSLLGAVKEHHLPAVEILLSAGANINTTDPSTLWTPLHMASFTGDLNILELLLGEKPDLSVKSRTGETPLDVARWRGNKLAEQALLDAGAADGQRRSAELPIIPFGEGTAWREHMGPTRNKQRFLTLAPTMLGGSLPTTIGSNFG